VLYPGGAIDISVCANGSVWIISSSAVNGGYGIYCWTGNTWGQVAGAGVAVAVAPNGHARVVNAAHGIYSS
jgi:hypothetical protein